MSQLLYFILQGSDKMQFPEKKKKAMILKEEKLKNILTIKD